MSVDDNLWAVGPDWWPDGRYAESTLFANIYRVAYRQSASRAQRKTCLGNLAEYPMCLGYAAFAVRELLARVEPSLLLGESKSLGVAVGFDSGDFILLGEITARGLTSMDPSARPQVSVSPLLEDLRSSDGKKVFLALLGVKRLGDRAREAVPELLRIARTAGSISLRQFAINALSDIAPDRANVKSAVLQALDDSSPFVRREALQALISIKDLSAGDLSRIKQMKNDEDETVASWSEIAVRNIRMRCEVADPNRKEVTG